MSAIRPIHHTFAPLADRRFCAQALRLLFQPWTWKRGNAIQELRNALRSHFNADTFLFASGREGLYALLHALGIAHGDEVIVQAYTCVVVPNAIAGTGATPVFVDIEKETLSLDPVEVRKMITPKTKAVICQHTFGIPAPLEELRAICDEHRIPLIEDCAHVIPSSSPEGERIEGEDCAHVIPSSSPEGERIEGEDCAHVIPSSSPEGERIEGEDCAHMIADEAGPAGVGMTGDFVMLSFGRDKAISGVTGGAILSRRTDVSNRLQKAEDAASDLSLIAIKRFLLYPLIYAIARPFYGLV
ncbi:aminotransferase class I/II-fold pyridoxal phosphate-dependent enzyme, partial [Candidatus Peribacteria bacterium]|nr:aminotransferase class I/II-fold pyridoxal phosphate-dependent enzyme [Candidatus Peribacteria bacterium]